MAYTMISVVFLALALAASSVNAFEIESMSAQSVQVKEGEDMEFWCKSDDYWEWCEITHVATDTSCEHVWNKDLYNVKVGGSGCDDFEGRFEYIGDKGASVYKCGIKVKNVRPEEAGEWKCDITSYYDGYNKWKSYGTTVSKKFNVEVEIKTTTTTTTTTPKPVTTDYVYDYPEADEVEEGSEESADGSGTNNAQTGNKKKRGGSGVSMTYVIIIVVAVVVICVLIVLGALHYKKKLPAFGGAGKNFKPVDQNETAQSGEGAAAAAADDPEEEAKHPSIVKANGSSNGVSPTKEAAKPDEAEINPELTKVTWTSEKEKAEAEGENKPLKDVEDD